MSEQWVNAESLLRENSDVDDFIEDEFDDVDVEELREALLKYLASLVPKWHWKAACSGMDLEVFFGNKDIDVRPALTVSEIKRAKAICAGCTVSYDCFKFSIENRERYGVWAGTSGRTRARIFSFIDSGKVTEEQVIEDFLDGNISKYEKVKKYRSI